MGLPILDVVGVVSKIVDKVIPDPQAKMNFQLELTKIADQEAARAHDEEMGQIGTNTEEAKTGNLFVAGWRPFIGWTGGVGLAYSFVIAPLATWTATVIFHYHGTFPSLDTGQLMDLVMGMLGFGGLRTYEKIKGVQDSKPLGDTAMPTPIALPAPKKKVLGISWPF